MTDADFDEMTFRLVRIDHPDAVKMAVPDGGVDTLLPLSGRTGYERGWQAKHYPNKIDWRLCEESLDRAVETWKPERITFCFPQNLTKGKEKAFAAKLAARQEGVIVDFWNASEIVARLTGSDEGARVAYHFFGDPPPSPASLERTIRAGGAIDSSDKVGERNLAIGAELKGRDPFFSYPSGQHELGSLEPAINPDVAMRVQRIEDGVVAYIDAVPRDDDAMRTHGPAGRFIFNDPEAVTDFARRLDEIARTGGELTLDEGTVEMTFDQLPPLFQDHLHKPISNRITIRAAAPEVPPWPARVHARSDRGYADLDIDLSSAEPPNGWDVCLRGERGGLTMSVLFRWSEQQAKGQITLRWSYTMTADPAREQLAALRLLDAIHGQGTIEIEDRSGDRPALTHLLAAAALDDHLAALRALFDDIVVIEEWTGEAIDVSSDGLTGDQVHGLAQVAQTIRDRGHKAKFEGLTLRLTPEQVAEHTARPTHDIELRQTLEARVLDKVVTLGETYVKLPPLDIVRVDALGDDPTSPADVRMAPDGGEAEIFIELQERPGSD